MKKTFDILRIIVDVSGLTNKWLMWDENSPVNQEVFGPSIFQLRDAEAHLIKIFYNAIENKLITTKIDSCNFEEFFTCDYTYNQLREVFSHTARAFYDCADNIIINLFIRKHFQK